MTPQTRDTAVKNHKQGKVESLTRGQEMTKESLFYGYRASVSQDETVMDSGVFAQLSKCI